MYRTFPQQTDSESGRCLYFFLFSFQIYPIQSSVTSSEIIIIREWRLLIRVIANWHLDKMGNRNTPTAQRRVILQIR